MFPVAGGGGTRLAFRESSGSRPPCRMPEAPRAAAAAARVIKSPVWLRLRPPQTPTPPLSPGSLPEVNWKHSAAVTGIEPFTWRGDGVTTELADRTALCKINPHGRRFRSALSRRGGVWGGAPTPSARKKTQRRVVLLIFNRTLRCTCLLCYDFSSRTRRSKLWSNYNLRNGDYLGFARSTSGACSGCMVGIYAPL